MKTHLLEPDNFSENGINNLKELGSLSSGYPDEIDLGVSVLFVRLAYQVDKSLLKYFPNLKFVISPTTGEDHINKNLLQTRNIELLTLKGEIDFLRTIPATAEFTWLLILSLTRNIVPATESVRKGEWDRDKFRGTDIHGKTLGIVGYGRIGKLVSKFALAFGMKVSFYDPYVEQEDSNIQKIFSLEKLAQISDVFSIHVNLREDTANLIDTKVINNIRKSSFVVNTSRGEILDNESLLLALKNKNIAGAGIDVLPQEREDTVLSKALVKYANENTNLLITPHLGGATRESMAMTEDFMISKLIKSLGKS